MNNLKASKNFVCIEPKKIEHAYIESKHMSVVVLCPTKNQFLLP